jgi:hypothetical protein
MQTFSLCTATFQSVLSAKKKLLNEYSFFEVHFILPEQNQYSPISHSTASYVQSGKLLVR